MNYSSAPPPPAWHALLSDALANPPQQQQHASLSSSSSSSSSSLATFDASKVTGTLLPYQVTAIKFALARGGRVLLGHEMGLGKTPMAITIARHCMALGEGCVLVVAPPVLVDQWRSEILQCRDSLVV